MDEDTELACWNQIQMEEAQQQLKKDPDYEKWLNELEKIYEIPCESEC